MSRTGGKHNNLCLKSPEYGNVFFSGCGAVLATSQKK